MDAPPLYQGGVCFVKTTRSAMSGSNPKTIPIILAILLTAICAGTLRAQPDSLWAERYGGNNGDVACEVVQTEDGGFVMAGTTLSFDAGLYSDFWLVKADADGDSVWAHRYGGTSSDQCNSMAATADGGFVLAGTTQSFGAGGGS